MRSTCAEQGGREDCVTLGSLFTLLVTIHYQFREWVAQRARDTEIRVGPLEWSYGFPGQVNQDMIRNPAFITAIKALYMPTDLDQWILPAMQIRSSPLS